VVVVAYIAQANTEIQYIYDKNIELSNFLNKNWNITGTQLAIEQQGRDMALMFVRR